MIRKQAIRWTIASVVVVALIAAAPKTSVEDLIRQGNAAVARKDFADAVKCFEQAEERALDPGLVAYNKGVALYQQAMSSKARPERIEHFKRAAIAYRCAIEGAEEVRQIRAHFGLGNSLVQGRPDEVKALTEAIASYRRCLESDILDELTREDVRNNLEIAKVMLLRARTKPQDPEDTQKENGDTEEKPPKPKDVDKKEPKDNGKEPTRDGGKPEKTDDKGSSEKDKKPEKTDEKQAGQGAKNAIFDPAKTPPLSRAESEDELEKAVQAIEDARKAKQIRVSSLPNGNVKDW